MAMHHPLISWNVFEESINRRLELRRDLQILRLLMLNNGWENVVLPFESALIWENKVIVVTDSVLKIVHATENITLMNGYTMSEIAGKTPKIFQGERTENIEKEKIKSAIVNSLPFDVIITNYRKDGSLYKCHIESCPIFNNQAKIVNYLAIENVA